MLEEQGVVVQVNEEFAVIQTQRTTSCGQCATKAGCSTGNLTEMLGPKYTQVTVFNPPTVHIGDTVTLGLAEQALVRGSLILYLVPLLCLITGSLSYQMLAGAAQWPSSEELTVISGIVGFSLGLLWVKRLATKMSTDIRYQPVILKIVR